MPQDSKPTQITKDIDYITKKINNLEKNYESFSKSDVDELRLAAKTVIVPELETWRLRLEALKLYFDFNYVDIKKTCPICLSFEEIYGTGKDGSCNRCGFGKEELKTEFVKSATEIINKNPELFKKLA